MQQNIPTTAKVLSALMRADFTTQWRNRRSLLIMLLVPVIILISWKGLIEKVGGPFVLSSCITVGLTAIGLMGYSNSIARDRDKGIFQRLRVSPIPGWTIMVSRLLVQLAMILLMITSVFVAGHYFDHITLSPSAYILGYITALAGGALYLGLGQAIVGRVKNPETVNSVTRLVYFLFIMIGMFGELGMLGKEIAEISKWSPYGTVKNIVLAGLRHSEWNTENTMELLLTAGYALLFSVMGIKWFKWNTK